MHIAKNVAELQKENPCSKYSKSDPFYEAPVT